jgi:hypothetical protein
MEKLYIVLSIEDSACIGIFASLEAATTVANYNAPFCGVYEIAPAQGYKFDESWGKITP